MEQNVRVRFGSISACIAGDRRYTTQLVVMLDPQSATFVIEQLESGANGGMDGDGTATGFRVTRTQHCDLSPKHLVHTLKRMIEAENPQVIKRYGTPSKRFSWEFIEEKGLSIALAVRALNAYQQENL